MAIVTVSRGSFSGGVRVAECVSEKLGYRCLGREELIETAAKQYKVRVDKLYEAVDAVPSIWNRLGTERSHYLTCLRAALVREVSSNDVVYHGYAGHFLLNGVPNVLKVRITANMEFRIQAVIEQNHLIREKAIDYIRHEDEKRAKWTRFLYGVDWNDPSCYDLVIYIDTLDVDDTCELVVSAAKLDKFKTTPETMKTMTNVILAADIRAILATKDNLIDTGITVAANDGIVTLGGMLETDDKADKIIRVVKEVPGVSGINSRIRIRPVF